MSAPAGAPRVGFWFEFASTYSYPAAMRIESEACAKGVTVLWRPFLLGPIFAAQGMADSPFNLHPAKGRHMWRDLERICAAHGLPFTRAPVFPARSLLATRVALLGQDRPWGPAFVRAVFRRGHGEGADIAAPEVIADALREAGETPALLEAAGTPETKDALRAQVAEADRLGIFGAPSFVVGEELFWGQDRLETALDWARGEG